MACEVSNDSPFAGAAFDDSWLKSDDEQTPDLAAIADFNNSFDANTSNTVDPQHTFSNPSTPNNPYGQAYNAPVSGLAETLSPEPSAYGTYQTTDFGGRGNNGQFFQSIEPSQAPAYHALPPRDHHFRRSVSEPPGGPGMPPSQQPPMTFHRDNHYLGKPKEQQPMSLKSLPRNKQQRRHPFPQKIVKGGYEQLRPEHRRTQTQPVHHFAPTSAPAHMPMPQQYMPQAMMHGYPYVSARVCTPSPAAGTAQSPPQMIDPALSAPATPSKAPQQTSSKPANTTTIPLTVDELRNMIFEAVQQAMGNTGKSHSPSEEDAAVAKSPAQVVAKQESREEVMIDQFVNDQ